MAAATSEQLLVAVYTGDIPVRDPAESMEDRVAVVILRKFQPALLDRYSPRAVIGDGNCCYRSVSLGLYGVQDYHLHVRLLTAIEMLKHAQLYDVNATDYSGGLDPGQMFVGTYGDLVDSVTTVGGFAELMHFYGISAAMGMICKTIVVINVTMKIR